MRALGVIAGGLALLVALATGAFFGSLYAPDKRHYQSVGPNSGQAYPGDSPRNGLADISGVDTFFESAVAQPKPRNADERQERDLAAQESATIVSYWTFWAVIVQTFLAFGALFALIKDLRQNRKSAEAQTRAYISVKKIEPEITVEGQFTVGVSFENSGHSPARNLYAKYRMTMNLADDPENWDIGDNLDSRSISAIGPGIPFHIALKFPEVLTLDDKVNILKKSVRVFIFGEVSYDDIFGLRRFTRFRAEYDGKAHGFVICDAGNDAD